MAGLMGFPARGFRPNQSYDESYSSDSDTFGRDPREQRRRFADFQRQAYLHRFQDQQSSPLSMGGFQSPFLNRRRNNPMMGPHAQFGIPSPLGMGMGMGMGGGRIGGMGFGMGMGAGMGLGMGGGMGRGMGMGIGRGGSMGFPGRSPFLGGSPMGYRQPSPFGLGPSHRSHLMFTNRYRQNAQPSWPQSRRSPFVTSFYDDDEEDDESDYDTSSTYSYPRRRRGGGLGQFRRSPYQSRHTPRWIHGHNNRYEEYDDEDDEDDESDYEDYYPVRRRRPRY